MNRMLLTTLALILTFQIALADFFEQSKWDYGQKELSKEVTIVPGKAPIHYKGITIRERELYGYNPRYIPAAVTFDNDNHPYMITGVFDDYYATHDWADVYVQTLNDEGKWVVCDLNNLLKSKFPDLEKTQFYSGTHLSEKICFDDEGGMYFIAKSQNPSSSYLFYSGDKLETFSICKIKDNAILEQYDSFNPIETTPVMGFVAPRAEIAFINKHSRNLSVSKSLDIDVNVKESTYVPQHSGAGNAFITIGDKTHIVYIDLSEITPREFGTKQNYTCYDHKTRTFSEPVYLGFTTSPNLTPDSHNGPAITVDSEGTLHVVLGSHGRALKYTYSTDNGKTWAKTEDIKSMYGGTYPALVTDKDDTIHLVSRLNGGQVPLKYALHHLRKEKGKDWQDMGRIMEPDRLGYNIYYHNLTVDKKGRLFLSYFYYAAWLSDEEKQEYKDKWPGNPDPDKKLYAHDPVVIMSEDGRTWKLATTQDFVDGITKKY
ncbi:MAG: BNR-4 repeat-containing protein [Sedimentisphaeraceae bacterium JB056]